MVHSPKVVVKRTVSVDMMLEDESLPFLLVVAGRTAGNNQPHGIVPLRLFQILCKYGAIA